LGLSIVSDLMRAWGGSANAANHPEGGAVITLRFQAHNVNNT
jgi:C4-dicarboxylate-specific signal transduction histidine kinase